MISLVLPTNKGFQLLGIFVTPSGSILQLSAISRASEMLSQHLQRPFSLLSSGHAQVILVEIKMIKFFDQVL